MNEKLLLDHDVYRTNRAKYHPDDLLSYENEWVAWNLDASRMVAHHRDALELWRILDEAGIDSESVNLEWIPPGGEVDCQL